MANDEVKRLSLVVPEWLYSELEKVAIKEDITMTSLIKTYIKLGLQVNSNEELQKSLTLVY